MKDSELTSVEGRKWCVIVEHSQILALYLLRVPMNPEFDLAGATSK